MYKYNIYNDNKSRKCFPNKSFDLSNRKKIAYIGIRC